MRINLKFGIEFPTLAVAGVFSGMSGWLDNLQQIEAEKQCNVLLVRHVVESSSQFQWKETERSTEVSHNCRM